MDIVPATQVARGDGAIINPATSDLQTQILNAFAALVTEAGLEAALSGKATASKQDTGNTSLGSIVAALAGTLNVAASALPLPTGAASSALQGTGNTKLDAIIAALSGALTVQGNVTVSDGAGPLSIDGTVAVSNLPATQAVSAAVLPLPTGAATAAKQDAIVSAVVATGPGTDAFAVTASDSVNFTTNARSLYVGISGDVTVVTPTGAAVLFKAVPAGQILPVQVKRVNATGTTASSLVGLL